MPHQIADLFLVVQHLFFYFLFFDWPSVVAGAWQPCPTCPPALDMHVSCLLVCCM
jgi:hypothetical protein